MPKHKMKMRKHKIFDQLFSKKRRKGIVPAAGSIIQHQQQICNNNNKLKLLVIHGNANSLSISQLSTEEEEETDIHHTFCDPDFGVPVASCHDLVLLRGFCVDDELALYNPSTKVSSRTQLPLPPRPRPSAKADWWAVFYGFGLDPKSNDDDDYKVIRCLRFEYEYEDYHTARGFMGRQVVELYSLKTGSWKRIPYPHPDYATPCCQDPIYINEFNYWIVPTGLDCEDVAIVSFDFAKECFSSALIPGPNNEAYKLKEPPDERHSFLLAEYKGSLALVVFDNHEKQLEVWVCNLDNHPSYSWSSVGVWVVGVDVCNPLAFLKNRLFYFEDFNCQLVFFDCETQKLKYIHSVCVVEPLCFYLKPFLARRTT